MSKKRWLAHPWLTGMLAVSWLLLQHSLEPVHLLSAALIGIVLPRLLHDFLPREASLQLAPMLTLTRIVLWDIVISNITVARLVLGPIARMHPAWVPIPLALTHPTAISLLATIITTTPGTVSCTIDEQRRQILVHALDCDDPAQMAKDIKNRYEVPLLAIFEHASPHPGESA
ncbi:MAG: Na+/H+ antiporter subunit E [Rhodoferax sp.]|nr:Na+/H+ antiporter subunit E [Rhodoferax sp.]